MARMTRKEIKHDEFVDGTWRVVERLETYIKPILIGAGAVVAAVVVIAGLVAWQRAQANEKADILAQGMAAFSGRIATDEPAEPADPYAPTFESEQQRQDATLERLEKAVDAGGDIGHVAAYLKGVALIRADRANEAIPILEDAVRHLGDDPALGGPIRARLAHAHAAVGAPDKALEIWQELAAEGSGYARDVAMLEVARLQAGQNDGAAALQTCNELLELYPNSPVARKAEDLKRELGEI